MPMFSDGWKYHQFLSLDEYTTYPLAKSI